MRNGTMFIAFPDESKAGRIRFYEAMIRRQVKIHGCWSTHGGFHTEVMLVECRERDAFAADCGAKSRPIRTELYSPSGSRGGSDGHLPAEKVLDTLAS